MSNLRYANVKAPVETNGTFRVEYEVADQPGVAFSHTFEPSELVDAEAAAQRCYNLLLTREVTPEQEYVDDGSM